MIEHFKQNKVCQNQHWKFNCPFLKILPARYLLTILHEARKVLKGMTTLTHLSTNMSGGQVTICGGKYSNQLN